MFNKKPPAAPSSPPPARSQGWAMQVVTVDYIVNGYLSPCEMPLIGYLNMPGQAAVTLSGVKFSPLGTQTVITDTAPEVTLPKAAIIAIILRDSAGASSAAMHLPPKTCRAAIYAGQYVVRADFRLAGDGSLGSQFNTIGGNMFAVTDAEVHCQIPGANFLGMKSAVVIMNKLHVQLYHPM